MKHLATLLAALVFAMPVISAEPSKESLDIAMELVSAMKISDTIAGMKERCDQALPNTNYDPKYVIEKYPKAFNGITPSSELWPEIEDAYKTYRTEQCNSFQIESYIQIAASEYAQSLSTDQLKQLLSFYQSETGKAFVIACQQANFTLQVKSSQMAAEHQKESQQAFQERMKAIFKKQEESDAKNCKAERTQAKKKR